MSIVFFPGFGQPIIGFMIDKIGKRPLFLIFANFLILCSYIIWALIEPCSENCEDNFWPIIPLLLLGSFICVFSASNFSCIPPLVNPNHIGTAFGLAVSIKNIGKKFLLKILIKNFTFKYFFNS